MSPTHANKKGVRYRYYVSQALLQNRKGESGSIARVPAPEIESLVWDGVRKQLVAMGRAEPRKLMPGDFPPGSAIRLGKVHWRLGVAQLPAGQHRSNQTVARLSESPASSLHKV